jgi:glycerol uptake facilitator-like aquaporin
VFLAAIVVGSGVMGARLAGGEPGLALLGNTLATAAGLYVLVTALAPISGAHLNPAVTLAFALRRDIAVADAALYVAAQTAGCALGAVVAHAMFELPLVQIGATERAGAAMMFSEALATFALVACIVLVAQARPQALAAAVALTIAAGYWWTSSTSFANPAITIARSLSDTFAGIRPQDAPGFIAAQILGAVGAVLLCGKIQPAVAQERLMAVEQGRSARS